MVNWIRHDHDWRKHEKWAKPDPRAKKLLDAIKDIARKINRSKPATISSGYQTVKVFEDHQREFELQKSKAIMHISRLRTGLI